MPVFKFNKEHDTHLARELLAVEPYKFKSRSRDSGQAWESIVKHLNAMKTVVPRFRVTQKAVRDRAKILIKNYRLKEREEEKASGIEVPEPTELDIALEEISEQEKAQAELDYEESDKKKDLKDKANAEEMRLQALEKLGETKKRTNEDNEETGQKKRKRKARSNGSETLDFMREKMERDMEMKQEEMKQKRIDQQKISDQQNSLLEQMQLQQVNQRQQMQDMLSAFMQQSQQQSQTMLAIVERLTKK